MADEQKESKIKVEDLPQPEQELTEEEQKKVAGGFRMQASVPQQLAVAQEADNQE